MKIAQVAPLYESVPPKLYGGTERIVSYLTEELVRQGHEVTLFASGDSVTSARLVAVCPQSLRLNSECVDSLADHILMMEQVIREAPQFDLIHFHCDYLHFPLSRSHQLTNVTTLHGRLDIPDLVPLYREFVEMPVVSISDAQREPLPWVNWQGTVYHGLPRDLYQLHAGKGDYLAFLGRICPEKGVEQAIEIAQKAEIELRLAAKVDRPDEEYFTDVVKPLVDGSLIQFVGEITDADKNVFLGNALAILAPLQWPEPFGMVMIEAMACGTPVVAYPRGSVPEIIDTGRSGVIVDSVDAAVHAIKNGQLPARATCRQTFEERFTDSRMARDYLAIYSRLKDAKHGKKIESETKDTPESEGGLWTTTSFA
jgi:glycosyltransferase involved in cell wall biosynthesis